MSSSVYRNEQANPAGDRSGMTRRDLLAATALGLVAGAPRSPLAQPAPPSRKGS